MVLFHVNRRVPCHSFYLANWRGWCSGLEWLGNVVFGVWAMNHRTVAKHAQILCFPLFSTKSLTRSYRFVFYLVKKRTLCLLNVIGCLLQRVFNFINMEWREGKGTNQIIKLDFYSWGPSKSFMKFKPQRIIFSKRLNYFLDFFAEPQIQMRPWSRLISKVSRIHTTKEGEIYEKRGNATG